MFKLPEQYRVTVRGFPAGDDKNGICVIPLSTGAVARVIASDGRAWEHVSASLPDRTPTWEEMCELKDLFWEKEACVVQYHPPASCYVNNVAFCLHLWRPTRKVIEMPPAYLVGIPGMNPVELDQAMQAIMGIR